MSSAAKAPILYRYRKALLWTAAIAPLLVAGGLYWIVNTVVLAPATPGATTDGPSLARFVIHERGLPRLSAVQAQRVLTQQAARLAENETLRERFLATVRTSSPNEQAAFREHLLGVFKPLLMRHVDEFFELTGPQRQEYLDRRIVEYNRLSAAVGKTELNSDALKALAPSKTELLTWVTTNTTADERERAGTYGAAIAARVEAILADPELKEEFERRIGRPAE